MRDLGPILSDRKYASPGTVWYLASLDFSLMLEMTHELITLLHGGNQILSRQKLNDLTLEAQNNKKEIIKLDGFQINLNILIQSIASESLFGLQKILIIENLFSRINSKDKGEIISYLKKEELNGDIIFWEKKEISGTLTRWLPKQWQIKNFKLSPAIFKLLDNLKPNSNQIILENYHLCIKQESPELIFFMFTRRLRELILALDLGIKGLTGAPWQINKLNHQAKGFSLNYLLKIYKKLLTIDLEIKTGISIMSLEWQLDLFLANL